MRGSRSFLLLGFTLVELMVTIAVMVVLMAAAAPSFADFFDRNRLRGAADGVVSLISNARAEGVKNDLDVSIALAGSGVSWCLGGHAAAPPSGGGPAGLANPCDCTVGAECRISGQRVAIEVGAYPDIRVSAAPFTFTFDSTLGAIRPLGSHQVTLTSPTGKYDLAAEVNSLGQASICVPAGKPMISGIASC